MIITPPSISRTVYGFYTVGQGEEYAILGAEIRQLYGLGENPVSGSTLASRGWVKDVYGIWHAPKSLCEVRRSPTCPIEPDIPTAQTRLLTPTPVYQPPRWQTVSPQVLPQRTWWQWFWSWFGF